MNIRALKDAVARWQTYEDRGIKPHNGWGIGGDGNSCALGDIAHYENLDISKEYPWTYMPEIIVNNYLGLPYIPVGTILPHELTGCGNLIMDSLSVLLQHNAMALCLSQINDMYNRWPIAEVQRLIEWHEAEQSSLDAPVCTLANTL